MRLQPEQADPEWRLWNAIWFTVVDIGCYFRILPSMNLSPFYDVTHLHFHTNNVLRVGEMYGHGVEDGSGWIVRVWQGDTSPTPLVQLCVVFLELFVRWMTTETVLMFVLWTNKMKTTVSVRPGFCSLWTLRGYHGAHHKQHSMTTNSYTCISIIKLNNE